jgi:hypothetical protein
MHASAIQPSGNGESLLSGSQVAGQPHTLATVRESANKIVRVNQGWTAASWERRPT